MKIAIIGAGFTGLSSAYQLAKKGHTVTIFEQEENPGGLAIGYKEKQWNWTLEHHYHHWFSNDSFALNLAKEIHHEITIKKPHTNIFVNNTIYQLDSIGAFLSFPLLSLSQRIWHLFTLGVLFKLNPFWQLLEGINATTLPFIIGKKAYEIIWKPQLFNKLGNYMNSISLVWFWARIKKRTPMLAYPNGGFLVFAQHLAKTLEDKGVKIQYQTQITSITDNTTSTTVTLKNSSIQTFDKVIVTLPSFLFLKLCTGLPTNYKAKLGQLRGLGAVNLVLRSKKEFFPDKTYWLSVCDTASHIMAIVEHTNFIDKKNYNNEHLLYIGNYMESSSDLYKLSKEQILETYDPFLQKINPDYKNNIISYEVFKTPFAQPIIPIHYSKIIPPFITPLPNVYLANIEQVYPWDRGTNYAIELGYKIADIVDETSSSHNYS